MVLAAWVPTGAALSSHNGCTLSQVTTRPDITLDVAVDIAVAVISNNQSTNYTQSLAVYNNATSAIMPAQPNN